MLRQPDPIFACCARCGQLPDVEEIPRGWGAYHACFADETDVLLTNASRVTLAAVWNGSYARQSGPWAGKSGSDGKSPVPTTEAPVAASCAPFLLIVRKPEVAQ